LGIGSSSHRLPLSAPFDINDPTKTWQSYHIGQLPDFDSPRGTRKKHNIEKQGDAMKRTFAAFALLSTLLSGCAVDKYPEATGGSRSDGTVKLSYQVGRFEQPQVHMEAAQQTAVAKCKVWGYSGAEAFGGNETLCQAFNGYGSCLSALVTMTYQCTGAPSTGAANEAPPR
jgi:hypothetical protein